jgi:hypothetical protein
MNAHSERCPSCGSIRGPQARFCGSCGSPFSTRPHDSPRDRQEGPPPDSGGPSEATGRATPDPGSIAADGLRLARKAGRLVQDPIHLNVPSPARWQVVVGDLPPSGPAALSALNRGLKAEARRAATELLGKKEKDPDREPAPIAPTSRETPTNVEPEEQLLSSSGARPVAPGHPPTGEGAQTMAEVPTHSPRPPEPVHEASSRRPASQAPSQRPGRPPAKPEGPLERPSRPPERPARAAECEQPRPSAGPTARRAALDQASPPPGRPPEEPERPPRPPEASGPPPGPAPARPERGVATPSRPPDRPSGPPERPLSPPEATRVRHASVSPGPSPEARPAPLSEPWKLVIVAGPSVGQRYPLGVRTTIGRSATNTIQLRDDRSSRNHAELVRTNEGYWLRDLGSTNGTQLNGQLIRQPVTVTAGDRVQVGNTVLQVVASERASTQTEAVRPTQCTRCGLQIAPGTNFCGACGQRVG